jgi:hydroxymethylbilane synthase
MPQPILRLGTRGSPLAVAQSTQVAELLRALGVAVELHVIRTTGDRIQDRPLADAGGKGLFTKEIEQALLAGTVDLAVHSYKDVPVTMPLVDAAALTIGAVPVREDARDVLVASGAGDHTDGAAALRALPPGARVATGSLRRRCQLLAIRPDLDVVGIRGNIDTRLRKWRAGDADAVVLAAAGLRRAGLLEPAHTASFDVDDLVPSAGQGALALQCRGDDRRTLDALAPLDDPATRAAVDAERAVVALLDADCHSPLGVHAGWAGDNVSVIWALGAAGGRPPVRRGQVLSPPAGLATALRESLRPAHPNPPR